MDEQQSGTAPQKSGEISRNTLAMIVVITGIAVIGVNLFAFYSFSSTIAQLQVGQGQITGAVVGNQQLQPSPTAQPQQQQGNTQGGGPAISTFFDDDAKVGSDNAPVVIIEWSDFQCPFCARFFSTTLPQLKSQYIDTGKVQLIYRDFPLDSIHPGARPAAIAAECAKEQGKWLEMHDKIFGSATSQGGASITDENLKSWGTEFVSEDAKFVSCFDNKKYDSEVTKDFTDGVSVGVTGTPSFLVGKRGGSGQLIVGAQPYEVFQQAIDSMLA